MNHALKWLAGVLKDAGLKVAQVDGWERRGHGDMGEVHGVMCHHTAGARNGNMPSLRVIVEGRPGLPGPLSQLGLGRDGTYYVIAAGRCNHAGTGIWNGLANGNSNFIGIEAENTGLADDAWPDVQMDAYRRGVAAILMHIGKNAGFCAGHKEYALPKRRKSDPSFDMDDFRADVAAIMSGAMPPRPLIPPFEPTGTPGARPTLRRGDSGELVKKIQARIGVTPDGNFGSSMEAALRVFQRNHGLVPDGIVGPKTWFALDRPG